MIVECKYCEAKVDAKQLFQYQYCRNEEDPPGKYTFLKCPSCESPFILLQEDFGLGWGTPEQIFPPKDKRMSHSIPEQIQKAFQEAAICYKSKSHTAAAIMCRKALEGICNDHNVKSGNLAARVKDLKVQGIIDNRLYEWAEALRIFGNEAAHDVNVTVSRRDAKDILEFTEALLEYIYTYRDKFQRFMNRRKQNSEDGFVVPKAL
jgi:hypothetical protein